VRLLVGIDAQNEVDPVGEHEQGPILRQAESGGSAHGTAARQDCGGSRTERTGF
jgi:hypothetical protein